MPIRIFPIGPIELVKPYEIMPNACLKIYEGNYEISIAIEDIVKSDMKIFKREKNQETSIKYPIEVTHLFFKREVKNCTMVYFTNEKLIKAIQLAKKLTKKEGEI